MLTSGFSASRRTSPIGECHIRRLGERGSKVDYLRIPLYAWYKVRKQDSWYDDEREQSAQAKIEHFGDEFYESKQDVHQM
jgi:hypothetical protein